MYRSSKKQRYTNNIQELLEIRADPTTAMPCGLLPPFPHTKGSRPVLDRALALRPRMYQSWCKRSRTPRLPVARQALGTFAPRMQEEALPP